MTPREFERLYAEHAQPLFGFLAYRTGDRALAEDLMADTFERALRANGRFDRRRGTQKGWLYAIALNLVRDAHRRRGAEARALEMFAVRAEPALEYSAVAVEQRQDVMTALGTLADEEREAIALRYGAGLTVPEVAKLLQLPLTTLEGRVYRALRKLRSQLSDV